MGIIVNSNIISENSYSKSEIDAKLNIKSDKDTTLSGYGITDGLGYKNITNCITEIPQDINLLLNNDGTFTLKTGSAVYIPTGKSEFTKKDIDHDITINSLQTYNGICQIYYTLTSDGFNYAYFENTTSGETKDIPETGLFYNIEENSIDYYENSLKVIEKYSFPLCTVRCENGIIKEILHIFNGFGYVGNTLYALPGVKGLIPDGKNEDGSYKNKEMITSSVIIGKTNGTDNQAIILNSTTIQAYTYKIGTPEYGYIVYSEYENQVYASEIIYPSIILGYLYTENNKIKTFIVKNSLEIVDSNLLNVSNNGKDLISMLSAPSSKYIDLELLGSETVYTMPANGIIMFTKTSAKSGEYALLANIDNGLRSGFVVSENLGNENLFLPVKINDKIKLTYTLTGETILFRFIYSEGAK